MCPQKKYKKYLPFSFVNIASFTNENDKREIYKIRTLIKNERDQKFWRNIIKNYTNNNFEEKYIRNNSRLAFYFEN